MLECVTTAPPDPILGLMEAFKKDPHPHKINLSVGVYQNEYGKTPILDAVKRAEQKLLAAETNKGYLGIDGLPQFAAEVQQLIFGQDVDSQLLATVQTPGGTGALRVAADFLQRVFPAARIWCSQPTWVNHPNVFQAAGLAVETYPYLAADGFSLDCASMRQALETMPPGDIVCLHACCHNPTGVDPTARQWNELAAVIRERRLLPLVDFAYQGFGDGLDQDAVGVRSLVQAGVEMLVCSSYSKNFGLYGERVGALSIRALDAGAAAAALSQVKAAIRANYSNPPLHGAAIVATVLSDPELRSQWVREVAGMRDRIQRMRHLFVETLKQKGVGKDFTFLTTQKGMFSFSGLTPMNVDELRHRYSIYIVGSGRINVAGMTEANMEPLCTAIAEVLAK
jgi:aspartate aminotransferase